MTEISKKALKFLKEMGIIALGNVTNRVLR